MSKSFWNNKSTLVDNLTALSAIVLICATISLGLYFNYLTTIKVEAMKQDVILKDHVKKRKVWERPMEKSK